MYVYNDVSMGYRYFNIGSAYIQHPATFARHHANLYFTTLEFMRRRDFQACYGVFYRKYFIKQRVWKSIRYNANISENKICLKAVK